MAIEVGDVLRVAAKMKLSGVGDIINVFHFIVAVQDLLDDDAVMDGVAEIMDDLYTLVVTDISPLISFVSVEAQNISKDELLPGKDWPVLTAGTNASEMLPEMCAASVYFRTIKPRTRASKFMPPYGETTQNNGVIDVAPLGRLDDFGQFLVDPIAVTDLQLGYVSFNRVSEVATAITSHVVPTRFRTQRRRRLGVGS